MSDSKPVYDLTLLLDTSAEAEAKAKILSDAEATIAKHGELVSKHDWGVRQTAYEVNKKKDAEYHLVQFHGPAELLKTLDRTLRITDGVLRHRIVKLATGVGAPPDLKNSSPTAPAAPVPSDDESTSYESTPLVAAAPVEPAAVEPAADESVEPTPAA